MAGPTLFQIRRTAVADREANTTTLPTAGEIGLNILDGRAFSTNGTIIFEIGANTKNSRVSETLYIGNSTVNVYSNSSTIRASTATGTLDLVDSSYIYLHSSFGGL